MNIQQSYIPSVASRSLAPATYAPAPQTSSNLGALLGMALSAVALLGQSWGAFGGSPAQQPLSGLGGSLEMENLRQQVEAQNLREQQALSPGGTLAMNLLQQQVATRGIGIGLSPGGTLAMGLLQQQVAARNASPVNVLGFWTQQLTRAGYLSS